MRIKLHEKTESQSRIESKQLYILIILSKVQSSLLIRDQLVPEIYRELGD